MVDPGDGVQWSATLATERAAKFDGQQLRAALARLNPTSPPTLDCQGSDDDPKLVLVNGLQVAILNFEIPAPAGLFDAAASPNALWPAAPQELARHRAHIMIVSPDAVTTREDKIARASVVTLVAAALCLITPVIGVHWPVCDNLISKDQFVDAAMRHVQGAGPAVPIWIRHFIAEGEKGPTGKPTFVVVTRGLRDYVGRDLEVGPSAKSPGELLSPAIDIEIYLLGTGVELKEGQTIGLPGAEKYSVKHADNGKLMEGAVYILAD
jgi:hypothetical protein